MPSIADTYVTIFPETSKIAAGVRTAFREVDGDAREAGRRWGREIQEGLSDVDVRLKADTGKAKAEIDETARDRDSTVTVDADTAKAESQIDTVARNRRSTINVDVDSSRLASSAAAAGAQAGSSMGGSLRTELIAAGVSALAAIASSASGLIGLVPAALGGAGLGIGTLVVGLDGVKDAWDAVGKAAKESGADQAAKSKEVASATRSLNAAVKDEAQAQKDVANARKDARQQLEDLNLELRGGAIDEKQAQLDALKARQDLATGTYETSLDYEQAQLRVIEADQRVDEAHNRSIRLQQNADETRAKGVDGADQVVAAENRLADAHDRVSQAQQTLDDANNKVSSSAVEAADAMAALSPAGQELITTLQGMMPQFQAFKFAIQDALLSGIGPQIQQLATTYLPLLQGVMTSMASTMNQAFGSLATFLQQPETLASMQTIFNNIGSSFATWAQSLVPLAQAFTKLTEVGSSFLPQLAQGAVDAAQSFAQFIDEAARTGELQQWIQTGITTMTQLGGIIKQLGPIFLDLAPIGTAILTGIQTVLASLAPSIGPLATAFASLITAITPILGVIGQLVSVVITSVAPALTTWLNALAPVIQQMAGLLQPVLAALAPVLQQTAGIMATTMVQGIRTLLPVLVPFVEQAGKLLIAVLPLVPSLVQLAISALPVMQQAVAAILPVMTQWLKMLTDLANIIIPPLTKAIEFLSGTASTQFDGLKTAVTTMWTVVKPILETMKALIEAIAGPLNKIGDFYNTIFGSADSNALDKLNQARAAQGLPPLGAGGQAPVAGSTVPRSNTTPGIPSSVIPIGPPFTGLPTPSLGGAGQSGTAGLLPPPPGPGIPSWGALPAAPASGPLGTTPAVGQVAEIAKRFGLTLTSGKRNEPGSYHNLGEAGDFSNGTGNTPQELAFAQYMAQNFGPYLKELIYSDPAFNQLAGGPYSSKTLSEHMNHVHVALTDALPAPGSSPISQVAPSALPNVGAGSSKQDIANLIIQSALARGYSMDDAKAILAYAIGESGLNPSISGGQQGDDEVIGLFQEKTAFSGGLSREQRMDPSKNIDAYLNQLDKHRGMPIEQALPATSVGGPLSGVGRQAWQPLLSQADQYAKNYSPGSGMPTGQPTDPMYIALSPNIPANQQKKPKDDSGGEQLGQDFVGGIAEIFGIDGSVFKDPTQFGLFKILKAFMGLKLKDDNGVQGGDGASLLPGAGGGGGLGGLLSFIPQPFGDLKIGSPQDAPGQFMPLGPGGSGGSAALPTLPNPFAPPNDPSRVAGPGNSTPAYPSVDLRGSTFGYSPQGVQDQIQQGQLPAIRTAQNHLPG